MAKKAPPPVIEYFERCFGREFDHGADFDDGLVGLSFEDQPQPGYSSFVTAGISKHRLPQVDGDPLHIELVFACRSKQVESANPFSILANMADMVLERHSVPPESTVIGPVGRFADEYPMEALWLTPPTRFQRLVENDFTYFKEAFVPIWCVPITPLEAKYIRSHGAESFERRIEAVGADMLDLQRPELVDHA